ncbi:MAG: metallophosphoesterase [Propionibacteriaceae bacterium]|jgi:predicted MPP superfamily phosphohydrolase|nr:metallophosphoesterase [Propionibacteriaceae bacterium]
MMRAGKAVAAAGMLTGGMLLAALHGNHDYRVAAHQAAVLPVGAQRIRVLHISDEHFMPGNHKLADFITSLASLNPDLVVSTGDSLASDAALDAYLAAHQRLFTVPGVFVFGSNDYFKPVLKNPLRYLAGSRWATASRVPNAALSWERLKSAFDDIGWKDVSNQAWRTCLGGIQVTFKGTDDAHLGLDDYGKAIESANISARTSAMQHPPQRREEITTNLSAELVIGVTHSPYRKVLDAMSADGVDVIFAGHTHGGQVCLPGGRALTTNCDLPTALASGLHRYRNTWLHVCPGLGTNPYTPLRLNCAPRACIIDLVATEVGSVNSTGEF